MHLYFAYGSNLDVDQMRERCPRSRLIARAALPDHRLAFGGFSGAWGGGVATAIPRRSAKLVGALYALEDLDLARLDYFEGCPTHYERIRKVVSLDDGRNVRAFVYVHATPKPPRPPSEAYLDTIVSAYRELGYDVRRVRRAAQETLS